MEDIDYKDLFRDAVLMMAAMARAAGFDPKDENVEPPDIVARVENQRAEVERLTADLIVARRLLPPRYIAADGSIMDPERCTPHASDCAECGRGRAHDEACLGLAATPAEESVGLRDAIESVTSAVERLTAERATIVQALDDDCAPDIDGQQVKTLADRVNALLGRWQDEIRGALCTSVPDPHRIDGGGCDSGDPLDLTLAEVAQAMSQLADQADEQLAALTAERDAARRDAEERRVKLAKIAHTTGKALWFDDSADYGTALWESVAIASPELADLLENDRDAVHAVLYP